jgi:hypothetical protein
MKTKKITKVNLNNKINLKIVIINLNKNLILIKKRQKKLEKIYRLISFKKVRISMF